MASPLPTFLPSTRSGRTFFIAAALLGAGAMCQLLLLGGFLLRGGIATRPTAEIHFAESLQGSVSDIAPAPILRPPALPMPALVSRVPAETAADAVTPLMARPTPVPNAHYPAGSGDPLEQARQLRARGDMNSALARLREAQVAEPDNPQVIAEMALTYEAMQIPDRAFEQWQRLFNLGEGVGALYYLADTKLHSVPANPVLYRKDGAANTTADAGQGGGPAASDPAILKLTDIHKENLTDASVEQKVSLKIVVKNRPGMVIDPTKVRILTYFYDLVDGKDTVLTDAQTDFAWLTPAPVNWANDKSEVLETTYLRPKPAPVPVPSAEPAVRTAKGRAHRGAAETPAATPAATETPAQVRVYGGYTVRLYYDRQLQDAQADPGWLLQKFQPPTTLPAE